MIREFKDIQYTLTRSRRKTASIYVERDGQITVIVPEHLTDDEINVLLEDKRKWIYKNLAEWHDLNARKVERRYVNGEGFLYLGRSYRLKLAKEQTEPLLLKDGHFWLRASNGSTFGADAASTGRCMMVFGEVYRKDGGWKFRALGDAHPFDSFIPLLKQHVPA